MPHGANSRAGSMVLKYILRIQYGVTAGRWGYALWSGQIE